VGTHRSHPAVDVRFAKRFATTWRHHDGAHLVPRSTSRAGDAVAAIVRGMLREELDFDGVILSDDWR